MDPEFAAAYAQLKHDVDVPEDLAESGKSQIDLVREAARIAVQPSIKYHADNLPPSTEYSVTDRSIPVEVDNIRARCIIPSSDNTTETFPVLVWFHGGAWVVGDIDQDDNFLRSISVEHKISVVNVDYRLAPEHSFPTGVNDAYAAVKWTAENAQLIRVSLGKGFVVGGDSSGANLATVCAHLARDDPFLGCKVTGQLLRQPFVIDPDACPEKYKSDYRSLEEFKDAPLLTRDTLDQSRALLQAPPDDPRFSPLLFPSHAGVAPAFVTYNGMDLLRDDSRIYARALREAGVSVKTECYPGLPHGFYESYPTISMAKKLDRDTREGLKWLLARAP